MNGFIISYKDLKNYIEYCNGRGVEPTLEGINKFKKIIKAIKNKEI